MRSAAHMLKQPFYSLYEKQWVTCYHVLELLRLAVIRFTHACEGFKYA
jgi:hypothetical protein